MANLANCSERVVFFFWGVLSLLSNFVIDILEQALKNSAVNFSNIEDKTEFDLEYADDIVCAFDTLSRAQSLRLFNLLTSSLWTQFCICEVRKGVI